MWKYSKFPIKWLTIYLGKCRYWLEILILSNNHFVSNTKFSERNEVVTVFGVDFVKSRGKALHRTLWMISRLSVSINPHNMRYDIVFWSTKFLGLNPPCSRICANNGGLIREYPKISKFSPAAGFQTLIFGVFRHIRIFLI